MKGSIPGRSDHDLSQRQIPNDQATQEPRYWFYINFKMSQAEVNGYLLKHNTNSEQHIKVIY